MSGIARTNEPVTVGVPLPDAGGIANTSTLGLTGASAAQFSVEGTWPDGNIKWLKIRAIVPSLAAGGTATLTLTNSGSGNFGGANLATDNGPTITVNTNGGTCGSGSAICFTVKKSNFDVIDQVQIGSTTVVASGTSQGLVVLGPNPTATYPGNVTCSPTSGGTACTTVYSTANDAKNSTCSIEENGPAISVLKCTADLNDGSGHVYMHTTTRLYFYQGSSKVRAQVTLRNADCPGNDCNVANFDTAYKGIQAFELRLTPNISGSLAYNIGAQTCSGGVCNGTLTSGSGDYAYIYQADSSYLNAQSSADYTNQCNGPGSGGTYDLCAPYTTLAGYAVMNSIAGIATTQATGSASQTAGGWGDISGTGAQAGIGVEIGNYEMTGYGNESVEFLSGGTDVRLGLLARENNTTATTEVTCTTDCHPYYIPYPQYHINDVYLNFHTTASASLPNEFLKQQHYLVARAPISWYNSSGALLYPLEDPTEEVNFYNAVMNTYTPTISSSTVVPEQDLGMTNQYYWGLTAYKYFNFANGGPAMQLDVRHSQMMNFIRLGYTGSYLDAAHYYKLAAELFFPRADFSGGWSGKPGSYTLYENWPAIIESGSGSARNQSLGMMDWNIDLDHCHFYGAVDYYLMSGEEYIHDFIDGPAVDFFSNSVSNNNLINAVGNAYVSTRTVGNMLMWMSRVATFEQGTGHASVATTLLGRANTLWTRYLKANLCVQSAGVGDPASCTPVLQGNNGTIAGTNFDRGVTYQFGSSAVAAYGGTCNFSSAGGVPRSIDNATTGQLLAGLWEFHLAEGPSYADYNALMDYGFGIWQMIHGTSGMGGVCTTFGASVACGEMYADDGSNSWSHNGVIYADWIDAASACSTGGFIVINQDAFWPGYYLEQQYLGQSQTNLTRQVYMELAHNLGGCGSGLRGSCGDVWHETLGRLVYAINHPPAYSLTTLSPSGFHDNGDGTYNITVSVPAGATSYRVKWGSRQIVDYIGYNAGTATWVGNPATTQNWWSSTDATGIPVPGSGTQTMTVGTSPATPSLTAANFMIKAYVTGSGPVTPPATTPPATTPPTVSMTAPANGATVSGTVTVSASATGSTSVSVQFLLDGANVGSAVTGAGPSYSLSWNSTTTSNGSHVLSAAVTDASGNTAQSGSVTVTVNNTSPAPAITSVTATAITASGVTITWTTSVAADSQVAYGLTASYGGSSTLATAMVTSHS
ncbi:MAG TPA: Ig-like domain-containing protein, partial [Bryobacteraceae bacterium]|nr:Ig-like domain-containing protein [Bryobacteraceae bacterium]